MSEFQHFLTTRFSVRPTTMSGLGNDFVRARWDPLRPKKLEARFRLFEMLCVPNIQAQTCKDFTWIILIDPALDEQYRTRIRALVGDSINLELVEMNPEWSLERIEWLQPFYTDGSPPNYLMTTNVDDDDGLHPQLMEWLQSEASSIIESKKPIAHLSTTSILQWDMRCDRHQPLGQLSKDHRGSHPASCGNTLLVERKSFPVTHFGIAHRFASRFFDFVNEPPVPEIVPFRDSIRSLFEQNDYDVSKMVPMDYLHAFPDEPGALMSNHGLNDQMDRLFETKEKKWKIKSFEDFSPFIVSQEAMNKYRKHYRQSALIFNFLTKIQKYRRRFYLNKLGRRFIHPSLR